MTSYGINRYSSKQASTKVQQKQLGKSKEDTDYEKSNSEVLLWTNKYLKQS